jgi:tetratricopeptide (TPR) repeat protein
MKVREIFTKFLGSSKKRKPRGFQNDFVRSELSVDVADPDLFPFGRITKFYDAPTKINQNLCRLRHGLGRLEDAISYLEAALDIGPDSISGRALIEAAYIKYATCFTDGKTSPNLNHKHLYNDEEELKAHRRAIDLRDKFLVHSSERAVEWQTLIAVDPDGNIFDTPTVLLKRNTPFLKSEVLALHLLMAAARETLLKEVSEKMAWSLTEIRKDGLEGLQGPFTQEELFGRWVKKSSACA